MTPSPQQRLEQSRERMRTWLAARAPKSPQASADGSGGTSPTMSAWMEELREHPIAAALVDGLHSWWVTHPLHSVWRIADETAGDLVVPFVRRHPVRVAVGAFAIGLLAARLRLWRWAIRPALFAGLATHLTSKLMSHGSIEFMLGTLHRFTARMNEPREPEERPAPAAERASAPTAAACCAPDPTVIANPVDRNLRTQEAMTS